MHSMITTLQAGGGEVAGAAGMQLVGHPGMIRCHLNTRRTGRTVGEEGRQANSRSIRSIKQDWRTTEGNHSSSHSSRVCSTLGSHDPNTTGSRNS
jgi:hypothetical protein